MTPRQEQQGRLHEKLRREFGVGVCTLLSDPDVIEIMANPDGKVWADRLSVGMEDTGIVLTETQIESAIGTVASLLIGVIANTACPLLKAELPDGERFQGIMRPVAAPSFVIRKHLPRVIPLKEQVASGTLTARQAAVLEEAVRLRKNILVAGATLSGKTVLVDSVIDFMSTVFGPQWRPLLAEDTYELHCTAINKQHLRTTENISLRTLIQTAMRLRPDVIIVGEVRGPEALDFLNALNTGHSGSITTIHATSAVQALIRLETLIQQAGVPPNPREIATSIHMIVMMERERSNKWRVREVAQVRGWKPSTQEYQFEKLQH